jgi:hypothetical protein
MPQITLKETITRRIDIPLDTLVEMIANLSESDFLLLTDGYSGQIGHLFRAKSATCSG